MENNNKDKKVISDEARKSIRLRVLKLEKYNYNQKEFTTSEMIAKIKKIIEQEVENDSKTNNHK